MPTEAEALLFHVVQTGGGAVSCLTGPQSFWAPLLTLLRLLSLYLLGRLMVNVQQYGGFRELAGALRFFLVSVISARNYTSRGWRRSQRASAGPAIQTPQSCQWKNT